MFVSKMALPRRVFLRGVGVSLGLPLLDAMVPALTAASKTAAKPTPRLGFYYVPNGIYLPNWIPDGPGPQFDLKPIMAGFAPIRDQLLVVDGLASHQASKGTGMALHAKAQTAFLSGVFLKETMGADFRAGKTLDQHAADVIAGDTPLRSLEVGTEPGFLASVCESGISCVYQNTMAWRTPTTPLPVENNPRVIFERLFGDGGSAADRLVQSRRDRSILDWVSQDVTSLKRQLGASDQLTLGGYLDAVRDVERRIQRQERQHEQSPESAVEAPVGIPESVDEHTKVLFDLQLLAFQADITRVVTYMIHREESQATYPQIGVPEAHHWTSHHGGNPEKIEMITKICAHHVAQFGQFAERLRATPDGDGTLLDHSVLMYGAGFGDGNMHNADLLPVAVVGGACGTLKGNRFLKCPERTPLMNLGLALMDKIGVDLQGIGDSTERLAGV